ncbi:MAG: FixH family protein [Micavibrio aeruginosavorus]|uniref:FixH family protein n=1 Tax=Micavibrio aeruginosavorus TaxID=349221 RepID=A0A7T5UHN4_9BACT|nr:MAG: FixH family protein [Micavibrio aeruginosavorus]
MSDPLIQPEDIKKSDKYIPWLVVAFFAVFMTVDAFMVTLAIKTNTGVITERAYEKGLEYNATLEAAAAQEQWNWSSRIEYGKERVTFILLNELNQPIKEAHVSAEIIRLIQSGDDFNVPLTETPDGHYTAPLSLPLPGEWKIRIYAKVKDRTYQATKMITASSPS